LRGGQAEKKNLDSSRSVVGFSKGWKGDRDTCGGPKTSVGGWNFLWGGRKQEAEGPTEGGKEKRGAANQPRLQEDGGYISCKTRIAVRRICTGCMGKGGDGSKSCGSLYNHAFQELLQTYLNGAYSEALDKVGGTGEENWRGGAPAED